MRRIQHWLENHLQAFVYGLGELMRSPIASMMTLLVIGIAMAFPATMLALLHNAQQLMKQWHHHPTISLYLKPAVTDQQANEMVKELQKREDVGQVNYISPTQGLQELQQQVDLQTALQILPDNPLPGVIIISPRISAQKPDDLQNLLNSLRKLPNIDTSQLDTTWIKRLYEFIQLGKRLTLGLLILFGMGVALIVGNTMRMAIQNHRQEIRVLKLIGATFAFIRRPMLYRGALYGFLGGNLAWLLVSILFWWLQAPAQRLAASYDDLWKLQSLNYPSGIVMIAACTLLGLAGAWLSVEHFLRAPEEDIL